MILKTEKILSFLKAKNLSPEQFAELLGLEISEVEKMLNGEPVGIDTARSFIIFFKAEIAAGYLDWDAMGIKNPYDKGKK